MKEIKSFFNNIVDQGLPVSDNLKGQTYLDNVLALQIGNGSKVLRSDESGLWLGAEKFIDAPFSVDMEGNLIANRANISGTINLGGVNDEDGVINIRDAFGNIIIKGDKLGHHYYNTAGNELVKIDFVGLHGYNVAGNELVKVDSAGLHGYLTGGAEQIKISGTGIEGYGTSGNTFKFFDQAGGTQYGQMGYLSASNAFYFASQNSKEIFLLSDEKLVLTTNSGKGNITMFAGGPGGDKDIELVCTDFIVNGVIKEAVVPTSEGYRALYCTESPEVWFMDFATFEKPKFWQFWKKGIIKADRMFLEVTEPPYITMPTLNKNIVQVWGKRKGMGKIRFEQKTKKEFDENNKFWNTPKENAKK